MKKKKEKRIRRSGRARVHSRWSFVIARFKSFAFGPQASHRYVFVVFVQGTSESDAGLADLCQMILGYEMREKGSAHEAFADALTAMKVVEKVVETSIAKAEFILPHRNGC